MNIDRHNVSKLTLNVLENFNHDSLLDFYDKRKNFTTKNDIMNSKYEETHYPYKERISNDLWDAQSDYKYGLSIIYRDGLYGVADYNYNIVFQYNKDIKHIEIISSTIIVVTNFDNMRAIYDIENGYITEFIPRFDTLTRLSKNIFKMGYQSEEDDKIRYSLILDGNISVKKYDSIGYNLGTIILESNNRITFMDEKSNILYEIENQEFYKEGNNIYIKQAEKIIKHELMTGNESIINQCKLYDGDTGKIIDNYDFNILLEKYGYYFREKNTVIKLFKIMKYGVSFNFGNGIDIYKWYDDRKFAEEFEKNLLESISLLAEKKLILKEITT